MNPEEPLPIYKNLNALQYQHLQLSFQYSLKR